MKLSRFAPSCSSRASLALPCVKCQHYTTSPAPPKILTPELKLALRHKKLLLRPKRQRFIVSQNLDQEMLRDEEFLEEFARLKPDGSIMTREELDQKMQEQAKKRKPSKLEKRLKEFERNAAEWEKKRAASGESDLPPKRIIDEEYAKPSKPMYVTVADGKKLESQVPYKPVQQEIDELNDLSAEALDEVKERMRKWRNKRMRREFRDKNADLIKNKLISTKELLREHMKELQQRKRVHLKREEKQQAHRLGLASGSLREVRSYMREKETEARQETKDNPFTQKDENGVAPYQYAYAIKLQEALQAVLENDNRNKYLEQVLIYHVRVDPSKRFVDVLWDYKYDENRNTLQRTHTNDLLQQAAGFLASRVGDRLKSKYAPIFTFYYYEDFSRNTPFHAIYDTFDELGFKTSMEERMHEYHSTPIFNPRYTSPQVRTKTQKKEAEYAKKQQLKAWGKSKWISAGRF